MNEPTEARRPEDARFAAGFMEFNNRAGDSRQFRVLYTLDRESGTWMAECLEHSYYIASDPGAPLAEIHAEFSRAFEGLLNRDQLKHFGPAEDYVAEFWAKVMEKPKASTYGAVESVLQRVAAPQCDDDAVSLRGLYHEPTNGDLALAA